MSREVIFYGLILVGSGLSQLIDNGLVPEIYKLYAGWGLLAIGTCVVILGLFWRWGSWQRPLGVTLLALSYGSAGLIALIFGGWLFTILFLLALVSFVIAWALMTGKTWGRLAAYVISGIGLVLALIGISSDGVIYVPGVLQSVYVFWYLNRSHVAKYFNTDSWWETGVSRRTLVFPLVLTLVLVPLLVNVYNNPPTYTVISDTVQGWGTGPGGGTGRHFSSKRGDLLAYSFEVDADSAPVHFYIESTATPRVLLTSSEGRSGSGVVEVPFTSQWTMWAIAQGTYMSVQIEMSSTQFSLQVSIAQWLLLDLCITALLLSWILTSKRAHCARERDTGGQAETAAVSGAQT